MWPYTAEEADILSPETAASLSPATTEILSGPRGSLASRVLAMPADANPAGNIFGGWIMSLMDTSGAMAASEYVQARVVTVAVTDMSFLQPVKVGDTVCCYAELKRVGRTSLTYRMEVWVLRHGASGRRKVTEAEFTFVCVGADGEPQHIAAGGA